jgi:pimeloyl-ACP methyl ester carboxylesterase
VVPALNAYANGDRETMRAIWNAAIYNMNQPPAADYERYLDAIMQQRNLVDIDYSLLIFNMTSAPTGSAPASGRLAAIKCPVVILQGEKDMVVPLPWAQGTLAAFGDRAVMHTFPNSGHSPLTDEPDVFMAKLKEVLA